MEIALLDWHVSHNTLRQPAGNAAQSWHERQHCMVTLSDERGRQAISEASPLPGYSPDDLPGTLQALQTFAQRLPWTLPEQLDAALELLRSTLIGLPPATRFGIESAVLQLWADWHETSLVELLAEQLATPPADVCGPVRSSALLSSEPGEAWLQQARAWQQQGVTTFKIKVGRRGQLAAELATLQRLRTSLGEHIGLRIDANQAWSLDEWQQARGILARLALQWVEEPLPWRLWQHAPVDAAIPIALDESLQAEDALPRLLAAWHGKRVQALVLKPTCLGLLQSLQLARWGLEHGLPVCVSHCWESAAATPYLTALALALPGEMTHGLQHEERRI